MEQRLSSMRFDELRRSLMMTQFATLNPSKVPLPKPKMNFDLKDFRGESEAPENYIHLRDNYNIINHDAERKNKMVRHVINKSVELKNKFRRENAHDSYMYLAELGVPTPNKRILINDNSGL